MLPVTLVVLFAAVCAATLPQAQPEGEVQVRERRSAFVSLYLCGSYSHYFVSSYPCGPCINCGTSCTISCSTTSYCQSFHTSLACVSGCCTTPVIYPAPVVSSHSVSVMTTTQCVGSCVHSMCPIGFMCTTSNLCCAF